MSADHDDVTTRVVASLMPQVRGMVWCNVQSLRKACESPIEVILGAALLSYDKMDGGMSNHIELVDETRPEIWWNSEANLLIPQYNWRGYRIDFALRVCNQRFRYLFIECDGHDFHERTKEQAARDRQRDRAVQTEGLPILRFTGSEINRDPVACVVQINEFLILQRDDRIGVSVA